MEICDFEIAVQIARHYLTDDFFFIQIGANDGKSGDPIHKYVKEHKWKGILVEPVPHVFKRLQENYKGTEGLIFVNAAVDSQDGYRTFYRLRENEELPGWYDMVGSFSKAVILKHRTVLPGFDKHLISEPVRCISFTSLLKEFQVKKIDLLHLDTEGYDFEIIKLIPFGVLKPNLIYYEHVHLGVKGNADCVKLLTHNGYRVVKMKMDALAYFEKNTLL